MGSEKLENVIKAALYRQLYTAVCRRNEECVLERLIAKKGCRQYSRAVISRTCRLLTA